MAAAVSIARWLLDEASSGTTPTTCTDDQGSNDLTIDYGTSALQWTSNVDGNGLQSLSESHDGKAELADISTNGNIGSSLAAVTEVSLILAIDWDGWVTNSNRIFFIGTDTADGDFAVVAGNPQKIEVRFNGDDVTYAMTGGEGIYTIVVDSTETTAADRCKVYQNDVLLTANGGSGITLSNTLASINGTDRDMVLFNRGNNARGGFGKIYYAELFNGVITATQASTVYTDLSADNDSATSISTGGTPPAGGSTPLYSSNIFRINNQ